MLGQTQRPPYFANRWQMVRWCWCPQRRRMRSCIAGTQLCREFCRVRLVRLLHSLPMDFGKWKRMVGRRTSAGKWSSPLLLGLKFSNTDTNLTTIHDPRKNKINKVTKDSLKGVFFFLICMTNIYRWYWVKKSKKSSSQRQIEKVYLIFSSNFYQTK